MRTFLRAFSLLEILISLSIVSLLVLVSFSGLMNLYQHAIDEQFMYRLIRILNFAHQQAINKRTPVGLCKSQDYRNCLGNWQDGQLVFTDIYGDGSIRNNSQLLAVRQESKISGYLHYRSFPVYREYILFTPRGWMANDNGTFWYCRKNKSDPLWAVILTKPGRIRTVYPDKTGEILDGRGKKLSC